MKNYEEIVGYFDYVPAAWVRVTGEDALSFLQGQFTQELRPDRAPPAVYGLWLNQKGRVVADSWVLRVSATEVWLYSEHSPARVICDRLEAYIIADDVTLEDRSADVRARVYLGAAGAAALAQQAGGVLPSEGQFALPEQALVFRGRRGAVEAWEWVGVELPPVPEGLPARTATELEVLRLEAGVPRIPGDVGPGDLPNEAGLDASAISYTKGCYLGQEVMARLKSMGRVRRRLLRVEAEQGVAGALPQPLYQGGRVCGELRTAATAASGRSVGLAMCTLLGLDSSRPLTSAPDGGVSWRLRD